MVDIPLISPHKKKEDELIVSHDVAKFPEVEMVDIHKVSYPETDDWDLKNTWRDTAKYLPKDAAKDASIAKKKDITPEQAKRERGLFEVEDSSDRMLNLVMNSPGTREFLSKPVNMAAAKDDIENIVELEKAFLNKSFFRKTKASLDLGVSQIDLAKIRYQQLWGAEDPSFEPKIAQLKQTMSRHVEKDSWGQKAWYGAVELVPQIANMFSTGFERGLQGAIAFGSGAALLGQTGPQIATPEEIFTVPAASLAGFKFGATTGSLESSIQIETGLAFDEFLDIRDVNGKPINPQTAKVAASIAGLFSGGLELAQIDILLKAIPGGDKAAKYLTRKGIKKALKSEVVQKAFNSMLVTYGKTLTAETMVEVMQEGTVIIAGELAKEYEGEQFKKMSSDEIGERLKAIAIESAAAMSLISAIPVAGGRIHQLAKAKFSDGQKKQIDAIDNVVSLSELRKVSPELFEEAVSDISGLSEVETVYIPAEVLAQKLDPDALLDFLKKTGTEEQYGDVKETNGDLEIPIEKYTAYISGTDTGKKLTNDIRIDESSFSVNEADEVRTSFVRDADKILEEKRMISEEKVRVETIEKEALEVSTQIKESLVNIGVNTNEANVNAAAWEAFLTTYSERGFIRSPKAWPIPEIKRGLNDKKRAEVIFFKNRSEPLINIFQSANQSSFLHETGHVWLRGIKEFAVSKNATEGMKKEWETIKKIYKIKDDTKITEKSDELFAQNMEKYFLLGKAPSVQTRNIFIQFSNWLKAVYKKVTNLKISDPVRNIFDRMLATDAQMEELKEYHNTKDGYREITGIIDKKDKEKYEKANEKADMTAKEKRFRTYTKAYIKALGGKKKIKELAVKKIEENPTYKLIKEIPKEGGINLSMLDSIVGIEKRKALAKRVPALVNKKGEDPNVIAERYGFSSIEEMVQVVTDSQKKTDLVKEMTDRMQKLEEERVISGLSDPKAIPGDEDYHSDERLSVILAEREILAQKQAVIERGEKAKITRVKTKAIRDIAANMISKKTVKDAIKYSSFSTAEIRASRKANDYISKGNYKLAEKYKKQEALNHALVIESVKARENFAKIQQRFKKATKIKPANIEIGFFNQIKALANKYKFGVTEIIEGTPSLSEFTVDLRGSVDIDSPVLRSIPDWPAWMSDDSKDVSPTKRIQDVMSYGDLKILNDAIYWLSNEGKKERQGILVSFKHKESEVLSELLEPINKLTKKKAYKEGSAIRKLSDLSRKYFAVHDLFPVLLDSFDGYTNIGPKGVEGPNRKILGSSLEIKDNQRILLTEKIEAEIKPAVDQFLKSTLENPSIITYIKVPDLMKADGRAWTYNKILAIALNMGNETNMLRVMDGYDLTKQDLLELVSLLKKEDLKAVQLIWDTYSKLWKTTNDEHFKAYNFYRESVDPNPITVFLKDGERVELDGGYYPIKYDPDLIRLIVKDDGSKVKWTAEDDILQQSPFGHPKVKDGFFKNRVTKTALPVYLDTSLLFRGLDEQINFITHGVLVRDLDRLTRGSKFTREVTIKFGKDVYKSIRPTLKVIAQPYQPRNLGDKLRSYSTSYILGLNPSVALKQPFSLFGAINDIGGNYLGVGMLKTIPNPWDAYKAMIEQSPHMRKRNILIDKQLTTKINDLKYTKLIRTLRNGSRYANAFVFSFIKFFDAITVTPIWHGAYQKGMKDFSGNIPKAIEYADKTIKRSQPGGTIFDVPALQRSESGILRFFGMFMSFTVKHSNRQRYTFRALKEGKMPLKDFLSFHMLESLAPPLLMSMMFTAMQGKESEIDDLAVDMVSYQFSGHIFLRGMAGAIGANFKKAVLEKDAYEPQLLNVPALEIGKILQRNVSSLFNLIVDLGNEKKKEKAIWALAELASYSAQIPASKVYSRLKEGLRQFEEEQSATPFNIILPDPKLRRKR